MADGKFQPGRSGNPGGRPKVVGEVRDLARQHTPTAIKTLVDICANGQSEAARVAASQALLDRGWGKAPQEMSLDQTVKFQTMTPQQRLAEAGALLAAIKRLGLTDHA